MASFWSETLALGIPEIDDEHKHFLELCEALEQSIREMVPVDEIAALCRLICDHSETHFANEEQLLRNAGYAAAYASHFRAHVDEHRRVLSVVGQQCAGLASADDAVGIALAIKAALLEHLLRWDLRYKEFMCGVGEPLKVAQG